MLSLQVDAYFAIFIKAPEEYVRDNITKGQSSFLQYDLNVTFAWRQNVGSDHPTICSILFYVEGSEQVLTTYQYVFMSVCLETVENGF